jgi:hypothetical protein
LEFGCSQMSFSCERQPGNVSAVLPDMDAHVSARLDVCRL